MHLLAAPNKYRPGYSPEKCDHIDEEHPKLQRNEPIVDETCNGPNLQHKRPRDCRKSTSNPEVPVSQHGVEVLEPSNDT